MSEENSQLSFGMSEENPLSFEIDSESQPLSREGTYQVTLEGVEWRREALYIGKRGFSPGSPSGHLVAFRDLEGEATLRGFTKFVLRDREITMKHAYKPKLSLKERDYLERTLEEAGL